MADINIQEQHLPFSLGATSDDKILKSTIY